MAQTERHTDMTEGEGENKRLEERLRAIIGRLDKEADDRVGKRDIVEKRWLEDLAQYHGRYTSQLLTQLKEARNRRSLSIAPGRRRTLWRPGFPTCCSRPMTRIGVFSPPRYQSS